MQIFSNYYWEKGFKTPKNQDSLALCQMVVKRKRCLMAVVCDGIGSLPESEKASGFVAEQLINWFYHAGPQVLGRKAPRAIQNAVNRELHRITQKFKTQNEKQGCTMSLLLAVEKRFFIWHVGDSRIYRGRGNKGKQMTRDDVYQGMLTGCMGNMQGNPVMAQKGFLKRKDIFLLCTDGFYKKIMEQELEGILLEKMVKGEPAVKRLLEEMAGRVRRRGETDDISAIYIKFDKQN